MECSLCDEPYSKTHKPVCASCAQATLYGSRIQQITSLLGREKAHAQAEAVLRPGNDGVIAALPQDADWEAIAGAAKNQVPVRSRAEQARVEARIEGITEQANNLRKQVEEYKQHAEQRKRENFKRREEFAKEREELEKRRPQVLDPIKLATRKTAQRLDKIYQRTVDARAYICSHSSRLCGLKDRDGRRSGRFSFEGLVLPNLKELNAKDRWVKADDEHLFSDAEHYEHVNASLDNVCRLVGLWCHYLCIRLPAEILLPRADFPHAAILPEKSSYKVLELPYPGNLGSHSSSPSASRLLQEQRDLPRARLLHLDRPLSKLAKEDPKTFGLFVEGGMLLAWDIAWLCRSQGITTINSFDDICDIGKNLSLLARAQEASYRSRPSLDRRDTGATDISARSSKKPSATIRFGAFSHGNLRNSLSGHEGTAIMRDWRLSQPHRLVDKLRNYLLTEITGAEWDVLSDGDFDAERDDEVAVLVGGIKRRSLDDRMSAMSVMSVAPHQTIDQSPKGESGWMKVRGRSGDA